MIEISPSSLTSTSDEHPVFLGMKLKGTVEGLLFDTVIEQTFVNPGDNHLEVVYTSRLPHQAVILDVEVTLGGKKLKGMVKERGKAVEDYEGALSDGDSAVMLELDKCEFYNLSLGNLAPKETCVVRMRYAQTLSFEQRGIRFLIPTVIAPHYGDPIQDGKLEPSLAPETDLAVSYPFEFQIDIKGALASSRIGSPSHPIRIQQITTQEGPLTRIDLLSSARLDRDLVIQLDQLTVDSLALLGVDMAEPQNTVGLLSFCPTVPPSEDEAIAVKFLVDCSGSMSGDSIRSAKRALMAIVSELKTGDQFSLSKFGNEVAHRSRSLWSVKNTSRLSAQRWIGQLEADMGGTAMEEAIRSTLTIRGSASSVIFLITDGEIFGIDRLITTVKESGVRIFVIGIGSSPSDGFLRRIADETGGAIDFVAPGEQVEPAILRMFSRLRCSRCEDLRIEWPEDSKETWLSPLPLSAYDADSINVFAGFKGIPQGEVTLSARLSGTKTRIELARCTLPSHVDEDPIISRMAASSRIPALQDEEVSYVGVLYQLITQMTNFILVHERSQEEKAPEMPEHFKVKQMLPAGWGGVGSVHDEPVLYCKAYSDSGPSFNDIALKPSYSQRRSSDSDMDREYLDIPAFLRRSADTQEERHLPLPHDGSPISLVRTLDKREAIDWPKSVFELEAMGISEKVTQWIQCIVKSDEWGHYPEAMIVQAFLEALTDLLDRYLGTLSSSPLQRLLKNIRDFMGDMTSKETSEYERLVRFFKQHFKGTSPDEWPHYFRTRELKKDAVGA